MSTKHTPGPWTIRRIESNDKRYYRNCQEMEIYSVGDDADEIVTMPGWDEKYAEEEQANANLISAAPELLAVLEEALRQSGCDGDLCAYAWHEKARAAIAKATGGK